MKLEDNIRIQHMIEASQEAISFTKGLTKKQFKENRAIILAIIKEIEIIGEAATKISKETIIKNPEIPWKDIIGMRNRLIHGYFEINFDLVWNTLKYNLPILVKLLKKIT